jgi:peroxiredoxin (alkyl hydroperoxide reductase subunit C)
MMQPSFPPSDASRSALDTPPLLYDPAPNFRARTTMGDRSLSDYRGRWLVFFSHPGDFTPVCTSEFIALARAAPRFSALQCELLALSVDSLLSHVAWLRSIREDFGVKVDFPIVEDPSMAIARAYGMIHPRAANAAAVRAVFVIDPDGVVRAITWYPLTTGRCVEELLRLVEALQTSDQHGVNTPEGWRPGDRVILPPPLTFGGETMPDERDSGWYYRTGPLPGPEGSQS